jgi:hypothetical protein
MMLLSDAGLLFVRNGFESMSQEFVNVMWLSRATLRVLFGGEVVRKLFSDLLRAEVAFEAKS